VAIRFPGIGDGRDQGYDAFISYSHAADGALAPSVQRCLHRLAKPWYRVRALHVFRDHYNLSANPDLWAAIEQALSDSRYLIFMASPEAATSRWSAREVTFWRERHGPETFLIALTGGAIVWDQASNDFDWERTTALPPELKGWFASEPLWVSLDWAHDEEQLSPKHVRFRDSITALAAPIHGLSKDELDSEDVRQHRVAVRLRRLAVSGLAVLTALAVVLGLAAWQQRQDAVRERDRAEAQARIAISRALATEAVTHVNDDPRQAARLALNAYAAGPTAEAQRGLMSVLDKNRHVAAFVRAGAEEVSRTLPAANRVFSAVTLNTEGTVLAYGNQNDERIVLWDVKRKATMAVLQSPDADSVLALRLSPDGRRLISYDGAHISVWDVASRTVVRTIDYQVRTAFLELSPDGRMLAATGGDNHSFGTAVWNLDTGVRLAVAEKQISGSHAFTPDSRVLLVGTPAPNVPGQDQMGFVQGRLGRLDLLTGRWRPPLPITVAGPTSLSTAVGVPRLAVLRDNTVEVWDTAPRRISSVTLPAGGSADLVRISGDGRTVVTGDSSGRVHVLDPASTKPRLLVDHGSPVVDLAVSGDGRMVASTSVDGGVTLTAPRIDHRTTRVMEPPADRTDLPFAAEVSPDARFVAVAAEAGITLVELPSGRPVGQLADSATPLPPQLSWSPDGRRLAAARDGRLSVWDLSSRQRIATYTGEDPRAVLEGSQAVRFLHDSRFVVLDVAGGPAVVDYGTGTVQQKLPVNETHGGGFVVSSDARTVVVANRKLADGIDIDVWRWRAGALHKQPSIKDSANVRDLAVTPDGSTLALADTDGRTVLHDLTTNRRTVLRAARLGPYGSVDFTADGTMIVQHDNEERRLALTDTNSGLLVGSWEYAGGHGEAGGFIATTSITPASALTVSTDGALHLWATGVGQWRSALCGMTLDPLTADERRRHLQDLDTAPMCPA
jgi:WD40 repeat protein